jgi:hypothetical protein
MNRNKIILLWAIVFVVTGVGAFLSLQKEQVQTSSAEEYPSIAIADTSAITSIKITTLAGNMLLTPKQNNSWMLDEKYNVRERLMQLILFGFAKMEVKRQVDKSDISVFKSKIKENGTLVEIKSSDKSVLFYLLPNPTDINTSIYADKALSKMYIIHVPGVKGDLATLSAMKESEWRSKDIFMSTPYSIAQVTMEYVEKIADNFEITNNNGDFEVNKTSKLDTGKVKKYLSMIPYLSVEKYLDVQADSVKMMTAQAQLYAVLSVTDQLSVRSQTLKIYFSKDKSTLLAQVQSSKEWVTLNPQIWRYAFVPKTFFEKSGK